MRSVRRLVLTATAAALLLAAAPAAAGAASYTGSTTQGRAMTLNTVGSGVTYYRFLWRVSCPRTGRSFLSLFSSFSSRLPGAVPIRIVAGRFRKQATVTGSPDDGATRGDLRTIVSGTVTATRAYGYTYQTITLFGPDRQTVVDTCRTGRIGWSLPRRG